MNKSKIIYYSGCDTKRGKDLAKSLGIPYIESYACCIRKHRKLWRKLSPYSYVVLKDFKALLSNKPTGIIFEYAGGILLAFIVYCYCVVFRSKLIIDCHTGAYQKNHKSNMIISWFEKKFRDTAAIFIAHNEETLKLKYLHGNMIVIESKVPSVSPTHLPNRLINNKINIVFITRFYDDEPIDVMMDATRQFNNDYHFYFTGNYKDKFDPFLIHEYKNVTLTGFIPDEDYANLLNSCDVIVVLTTRGYTLLYGGREAIAFHKPLVISNNETCRNYFTNGSVFVENDPKSIKKGILKALQNKELLSIQMKELEKTKLELWNNRLEYFDKKVNEILN